MVAKGPILSVVLLAIAACFFEPTDRVTGQWGGPGMSLDARTEKVLLNGGCLQAVSPELSLDAVGHFEGTARIIRGPFGSGISLYVSGDIAGDSMIVTVTYTTAMFYTPSEPQRYFLRRSVVGSDFTGCLK